MVTESYYHTVIGHTIIVGPLILSQNRFVTQSYGQTVMRSNSGTVINNVTQSCGHTVTSSQSQANKEAILTNSFKVSKLK